MQQHLHSSPPRGEGFAHVGKDCNTPQPSDGVTTRAPKIGPTIDERTHVGLIDLRVARLVRLFR